MNTDRLNKVFNCDCMEFMQAQKDCIRIQNREFPFPKVLAIVDPPYGIGMDGNKKSNGKHGGRKEHKKKKWDKIIPDKIYFDNLFRVSSDQIICGGNYFTKFLKSSMGWIVWDKGQRIKQSDGELIYTSFKRALRIIMINRVELLIEKTIYPTQKPIVLYRWLLVNYATPGQLILDTHVGSGSLRIACHDLDFDFIGCELDKDYWKDQEARYKNYIKQQSLISTEEIQELIYQQGKL